MTAVLYNDSLFVYQVDFLILQNLVPYVLIVPRKFFRRKFFDFRKCLNLVVNQLS